MKHECALVRDLLPLYLEQMLSPESSAFVAEHLARCPDCGAELAAMQADARREAEEEAARQARLREARELRELKKRMHRRTLRNILLTVLALIPIAVLIWYHVPTHYQASMTVCTLDGENARLDMDLKIYRGIVTPTYVKGTVYFNGEEYVDRYTFVKTHIRDANERLYPAQWWKTPAELPYNMTFCKTAAYDPTDKLTMQDALVSSILIWDMVDPENFSEGFVMSCSDVAMADENGAIEGVFYAGPAGIVEQVEQIFRAVDLDPEKMRADD